MYNKFPSNHKWLASYGIILSSLLFSLPQPMWAVEGGLPSVQQQNHTLRGTVVDDLGEPLPGVVIRVKNSKTTAITDLDGRFELNVQREGKVAIMVSLIGMEDVETLVSPSKVAHIQMKPSAKMMDEVIVTGFQSISRERATGSATIVNAEKLSKIQSTDLVSKIEGLAPGMSTYNNQISIRGVSSFAVDATPLLVIDGQPATGMSLDDINPENIENITVLKDAAATSLYGVRASNGVIVITTKRAKDERVNVSVSANYYINPLPSLSYQHYASTSDVIDFEQDYLTSDPDYIKSPKNYFSNMTAKSGPAYMSQVSMLYYKHANGTLSEEQLKAGIDALRGNDYRREYRKKLEHMKFTQDYNLSISRGGNKSNTYFSARYLEDGQYEKYNSSRRMSFYLKNDLDLTSWMKLTLGVDANYRHTSASQSDNLGYTGAMPYDRLYNEDGSYAYVYPYNQVWSEQLEGKAGLYSMKYNAVEESGKNLSKTNDLYMKFFAHANFDIMKGLNLEAKFQYEKRDLKNKQYDEEDSYNMRYQLNRFASTDAKTGKITYNLPKGGRLGSTTTDYDYYNLRLQLNYNKTFADKHDVTALVGGELRQDKYNSQTSERFGYDDQKLTYSQVDWVKLSQDGVVGQLNSNPQRRSENLNNSETTHRYVSAYMNVGYTYDRKYTVNGSVRVEQADLFGTDPKYRYRPLWSLGGSWNVTNEEFMKAYKWLNMLKVRMTYGITGNVDQSSSPYLLASYVTSLYSNSPITVIQTPPNSSLRWEKTSTFNFGLDFMAMNRLSGSFDIYRRYSSDLLVNKSIDPSLGFNGQARANNGEMENFGLELSLQYNWIKNRDLSLTTGFSAAYNSNKIKKVDYEPTDAIDMMRDPTSNYRVGDAYNSLYAYRYAGLTEVGNPSVYNENGEVISIDKVRNVGAVVLAGQLTPKWNGAFNIDFRWKQLSAFAKIVYYAGHSLRDDAVNLCDSYADIKGGAINEDLSKRWTPENTNTNIPAMGLHTNTGERNYHWRYADVNVSSASFIKMRNIGVAYSLPSNMLSALHISALTVKAQIDNLFYWAANHRGIDPEAYNANGGYRTNAQMPTYTIGLNINF